MLLELLLVLKMELVADFRAGNAANNMNTNEFGIDVGSEVVNVEGAIQDVMLIAKVILLLIIMGGMFLHLLRLLMMVLLPGSPHQFVL